MQIETFSDLEAASRRGAALIAEAARAAVAARGQFLLAASGGTNPWKMFLALANEKLPWGNIHVLQVDERVAPEGDPDRNLTHLCETLLAHAPLSPQNIHPMPVTDSDLDSAAQRYARILSEIAGPSPVIDLVHLGLGPDGHTASLVPGDPVLEVVDRDVAVTGPYQGHRRMTLTYPLLNRARSILWLVTGGNKAEPLARVVRGDRSIPGGRIRQDVARVLADSAAAARLGDAAT